MKLPILCILCLTLAGGACAQTPDIDSELSTLATKIGTAIKENGKKKVTVLDFTDLDGHANELGRYIAEQLTVNLVIDRKDFSVLDRANLKSILAEHKLTATGLVDPENAKKLGQFAGVDAIILGTLTPKQLNMSLTAKIITTDTAEIVGAAKALFRNDEPVKELASKQTPDSSSSAGEASSEDKPKMVKRLGDFNVEIYGLRIVDDTDYLLSLTVTNLNPKKTIYVALECEGPILGALKSTVIDPDGFQFGAFENQVTGLSVGCWTMMGYGGAVKRIQAHDSVSTTIRFGTERKRALNPGRCHVQLTFLDVTLDRSEKILSVIPRNITFDVAALGPSTAK
jgi:hypothetical protein